jgi:uncharacterized protein YecT (DUF1311 family)
MRNWIIVSVVISLLSFSPPARAEDKISCDGSTYEMVECLKKKTAYWDQRLNKAYQQALKAAASPNQTDKLRAAQRLWARYRDANCLYYDFGEGTIARIEAGECMRSMTEVRAKELEGAGRQ